MRRCASSWGSSTETWACHKGSSLFFFGRYDADLVQVYGILLLRSEPGHLTAGGKRKYTPLEYFTGAHQSFQDCLRLSLPRAPVSGSPRLRRLAKDGARSKVPGIRHTIQRDETLGNHWPSCRPSLSHSIQWCRTHVYLEDHTMP
jgi:hypothetical protein